MIFHFRVLIWKAGCPDPKTLPADVIIPIEIRVPVNCVPALDCVVQDLLISSDVSSAELVRFVDPNGNVSDFWNVVVD